MLPLSRNILQARRCLPTHADYRRCKLTLQLDRISAIALTRARVSTDTLCPLLLHSPSSRARYFSSWTRGTDLLADSLSVGLRPKVVLEAYAPSGFDVSGMITKIEEDEEAESGAVHMNSSIVVFPHSCFLWKVTKVSDITFESLSPVLLHRPKLEYLFLGTPAPIPLEQMEQIKVQFREKGGIIVEGLNLSNAMGTFNILNGEDRPVAAALLLEEESPNNL